MIILGIQEAHDASAALMIDGEIVAAVQEERFTRLKGDYGFPKHSVEFCLNFANVKSNEIDIVALASKNWNPVLTKIKRNANFSVDDWVKEQKDYWYPTLLKGKKKKYFDLFKDKDNFVYDDFYNMDNLLEGYMNTNEMLLMQTIRKNTIANYLGINKKRIKFITHEYCHKWYAYYGSHLSGQAAYVLTAEGIGDYSNATVSRFPYYKELARTKENHIGHIYQYITLLLGMKPAQHEYKVMGLAPYANKLEIAKSYEVFRNILWLNGMNIEYFNKPKDLYFHFRDALEGHRFDGIAGALQKWVEVLLNSWITSICRIRNETEPINFCFAGGVAQNIKAVKTISENQYVKDISVMPAAGDTSISLGACYYVGQRMGENVKPLTNIYLGPDVGNVDKLVAKNKDKYIIYKDRSNGTALTSFLNKSLNNKAVIGRCCGRMEFGHRALGNRSILANPSFPDIVGKINQKIKFRDFWMPFTPTISSDVVDYYIENPKKLECPYMTMAFDSKRTVEFITAAIHPADKTVRPQILKESQNKEYCDIVDSMGGAVLNTSFNIHGEPIVCTAEDALRTFDKSGLDLLVLNNYVLFKKNNKEN